MHRAKSVLAGIICCWATTSAWALQGEGLTADLDNLPWARWQGRVSVGSSLPAWQAGLGGSDAMGLRVDSVSLVGDYYFSRSLVGPANSGGFRTTGGLMVGPRSQLTSARPLTSNRRASFNLERHQLGAAEGLNADANSDVATLPYLGLGYSGSSLKGRWSFNADFGMMALSPGNSVKLGKVVGGTQSLDDVIREMRLAPIFQLGVSYSF